MKLNELRLAFRESEEDDEAQLGWYRATYDARATGGEADPTKFGKPIIIGLLGQNGEELTEAGYRRVGIGPVDFYGNNGTWRNMNRVYFPVAGEDWRPVWIRFYDSATKERLYDVPDVSAGILEGVVKGSQPSIPPGELAFRHER